MALSNLEEYFRPYRENTIGVGQKFLGPFGEKTILYADWTASGRLYRPIEKILSDQIGPFVANTHSESNVTGGVMTEAYHQAHQIIKTHVHASMQDVILTTGFGMTGAVTKYQRILGIRGPEQIQSQIQFSKNQRPIVFVTHMEHHSNHISWRETLAEVVVIPPGLTGLVEPENLRQLLQTYQDRPLKIGSFAACSNVTGLITPYHELARVMHEFGGVCFVDFAASAPYVSIDMHPNDPKEKLDAIFFSPHKFLGGPGTSGVLIFDSSLYHNTIPDQPGGGTVQWTNPWGGHRYIDDIEIREDGGTPGFLPAIKAALSVRLKEKMGVDQILAREHELAEKMMLGLKAIPKLHILADDHEDRLGIFSFYFEHLHYNLVVKLLSDLFGIQARGGCSCAGTYGHYLLQVSQQKSKAITDTIDGGDLSEKPGWIRISVHPIMKNQEVDEILRALQQISVQGAEWGRKYVYSAQNNEFFPLGQVRHKSDKVEQWFGSF